MKQTLKIGDKVKVIKNISITTDISDRMVGKIGTIVFIDDTLGYPYCVHCGELEDYFNKDELQLIKPKTKKVKKWKYSRKELAEKIYKVLITLFESQARQKVELHEIKLELLATQPKTTKEECKHELGDIEEHDNLGTYHTAGDTCIKCGKHILDFDNPKQQSKDIEMKNDATKGVIDNAVRRALNLFDKWNDVTGLVGKHTGYYYELQGLMEDAVHCGIQELTGDYKKLI